MADPPALEQIDRAAWAHLDDAVSSPSAALRCLTLGSVDRAGAPQLRTLILRGVDAAGRSLTFHTDIRSAKWGELLRAPQASVLGYDAGLRTQLRCAGTVALFGPGSAEQQEVWDTLPPWNRNAYCGGPPGHTMTEPDGTGAQDQPPSDAETAKGQARFGVIVFTAQMLDWYQHGRGRNMRARFDYDAGHQSWVTP
jgi:hypothetical protein